MENDYRAHITPQELLCRALTSPDPRFRKTVMRVAIDAGADPANVEDENCPWKIYLLHGAEGSARDLMEMGGNPSDVVLPKHASWRERSPFYDRSPLAFAMELNSSGKVRELLDLGCDPMDSTWALGVLNDKKPEGCSSILGMFIKDVHNQEIIEMLVEKMNEKDKKATERELDGALGVCLQEMVESGWRKHIEKAKTLIRLGARIDVVLPQSPLFDKEMALNNLKPTLKTNGMSFLAAALTCAIRGDQAASDFFKKCKGAKAFVNDKSKTIIKEWKSLFTSKDEVIQRIEKPYDFMFTLPLKMASSEKKEKMALALIDIVLNHIDEEPSLSRCAVTCAASFIDGFGSILGKNSSDYWSEDEVNALKAARERYDLGKCSAKPNISRAKPRL